MPEHKTGKTYMNAPESGTVAGSHVLVQGLNGGSAAHLAVLLVHVVGARARVVTNPDAEVLDLEGSLLVDNIQGNDLARRLLDLSQLHQEIPEARFGDHIVVREDAHAIQLRRRVRIGGQVAADDLVFLETT